MADALKEFECALFGGHEAGELHVADHGDGPMAQMFLMDAEYDPVRVSFDGDGTAYFHPGGNKWVCFTADQMRFLAHQTSRGATMTQSCYDEDGEPLEQTSDEP